MRNISEYLLAKARTSPDGEKPTAWTQPPVGLAYSPQIVLNGNFSPQTDAAGLQRSVQQRYHRDDNSPFINILDISGKYTSLHVSAARGEENVVGVPVD